MTTLFLQLDLIGGIGFLFILLLAILDHHSKKILNILSILLLILAVPIGLVVNLVRHIISRCRHTSPPDNTTVSPEASTPTNVVQDQPES